MKRRTFLIFSATSAAGALLDVTHKNGAPGKEMIRFIPETKLVPGIAVHRPGICTQCPAGCGLDVRVMEGDAEVMRDGQMGLLRMGLAKKLEGNPSHPVNLGKLCPRGQAGLQVTYNPDRIGHPLKRVGPRGSGQYVEIGWEEAIGEVVDRLKPLAARTDSSGLVFLTQSLRGRRQVLVQQFLSAFAGSALVPFEFFDDAVLREANRLSFGRYQLPTFDLAGSRYVISLGADFLGTWNSPVAQSLAYGTMRQGRSGVRGRFVQVESRMTQTGANADEWVPAHPGSEGTLALGLAHVLINEHLRPAASAAGAGDLIEGWKAGLPQYSPEAVAWKTGVPPATIRSLARDLAAHMPAVVIVGGPPLAQTNGLFTALAVNALNALLGGVNQPGGLQFSPQAVGFAAPANPPQNALSLQELAQQILNGRPNPVQALLLYGANPAFASPSGWQVKEALEKVPFIASFSNFVDETTGLADLLLPDHSYLESWLDHVSESGAKEAVISVAPPAMEPLHNTRATPDILIETAHRLGGRAANALPWKSYEEMLRSAFVPLRHFPGSVTASSDDEFWKQVKLQGGWWGASAGQISKPASRPGSFSPVNEQQPEFDGSAKDFPFHFLPFASQPFYDGRNANLPWLQEMPDVLTTAMWGSWVEINPQTAQELGIEQGDLVEVTSAHAALQAPAVLSPGIAPNVVAVPVGQGHVQYGRYATDRGTNPIAILGPQVEPSTGALAWAATRVRIRRLGPKGELCLFSTGPITWGEKQLKR
ncbi:MAG TPA: molybdopterin-dependent oxidoreductase [Candidatus Dormibacteraeota bacterium]|nr:molybdopterin-dependent oxidoreductase [Candidatus Dormibacteraeota bacterium]